MRKIVLLAAVAATALALSACDAEPSQPQETVYPTETSSAPATDRPERPNCLMQNGTACP